jgi:hypothetical protein
LSPWRSISLETTSRQPTALRSACVRAEVEIASQMVSTSGAGTAV